MYMHMLDFSTSMEAPMKLVITLHFANDPHKGQLDTELVESFLGSRELRQLWVDITSGERRAIIDEHNVRVGWMEIQSGE